MKSQHTNRSSTFRAQRGALYVILAALSWSTMGVLARRMNAIGLFSLEISQVRVSVAFFTISLFLLIKNPTLFRIRWKDLWCFIGTGLCSLLLYCICYFRALESASISIVTVLTYMSPVYIMLMSAMLFHEKITGRKILALCLSIAGCILVSGILFGISGDATGLLLGFAAGFFYALYSIFTKFAINRGYTTWTILFYTFGFAMIGCSFLCDWHTIGTVVSSSVNAVFLCLLFGVITCFVPYALYSRGLQEIEMSKASILNCLDVVSSSILGALFFREYPTWTAVCGIALVLTSVILLSTNGRQTAMNSDGKV